jgi:hypothetical protein
MCLLELVKVTEANDISSREEVTNETKNKNEVDPGH